MENFELLNRLYSIKGELTGGHFPEFSDKQKIENAFININALIVDLETK